MADQQPDATGPGGPNPEAIQRALGAIGAWSHLNWDELELGLDRIRHQSTPTPPFDDR